MKPQSLRARIMSDGRGATVALSLSFLLVSWLPLNGDEPRTLTPEQRAAHVQKMRDLARSIHVFEQSGDQRLPVKLIEQPVLGYRDATRKIYDSTMWVWGAQGRPSAIIAVEYYPERPAQSRWLYEIASLSTTRIAAEREPELKWKAKEPGLNLKGLNDAPTPAEKPTARLAQMRQLSRRFTAHERTATEGRIQLQPLSTPLHRYQDPDKGVLDGAIFSFANGTNPEVLWVIEAHREQDKKLSWKFGMAQMTGGEVYLELDGKEIWKCREADPPAERDSYINGWLPASTTDKE